MSAPQINPGDIVNWPILKITYCTDADKIVDSAGGLAVDVHRNISLEVTSGAAAGYRRSIRNIGTSGRLPAVIFHDALTP